MTLRPLTDEETAVLYAEMQRPASGYADEMPEERGWRVRVREMLGRFL